MLTLMLATKIAVPIDDIGGGIGPAFDAAKKTVISGDPVAAGDQTFELQIMLDESRGLRVKIALQLGQEADLIPDAPLVRGTGFGIAVSGHLISAGQPHRAAAPRRTRLVG